MDLRRLEVSELTVDKSVRVVSMAELVRGCVDQSASTNTKPNWNTVVDNFAALDDEAKRRGFADLMENLPSDVNRLAGALDVDGYAWTVMTLVYDLRGTELGLKLSEMLFDKLFRQYADRLPTEWNEKIEGKGITANEYLAVDRFFQEFGPFIDYLTQRTDDPDMDKKVGMLIRVVGMPDLANGLRYRLLRGGFHDEKQKGGYERMLRDILGYPEIEEYYRKIGVLAEDEHLPLPLSLGEVYASDDFSQYLVSLETQKFRLSNLVNIFEKWGIGKGAKICDAGCGTGWLTGEMLKAGYANVSGFDIDPTNLAKAREEFPEADFIQGEINEMGYVFAGNEQDVVLVLGRTATHASDWDELAVYLDEIYGTLSPDGIAIIDWPNPDVPGGVYQEYRDCVKRSYLRHGFSEAEVEGVEVVVDGPATRGERPLYPIYMYNQLTPHLAKLKSKLGMYSFDLLEEVIEELPNGTGKDQNVVLVLRKRDVPVSRAAVLDLSK